MTQLIPYSFAIASYPQTQRPGTPGQVRGVSIILPPDSECMLSKITGWFSDREEAEIVDHGVSGKVEPGYIISEWIEHGIDHLFLAILRDEEAVADFTTYVREPKEG
jgi:hypothetical protein